MKKITAKSSAADIAQAVIMKADRVRTAGKLFIAAIDGRCASGKSTAADCISEKTNCPVIRMDHFFLRPEQRTAERMREAGANVDRERFIEEVVMPLLEGKRFSYRPYCCKTGSFGDPITIEPCDFVIIEGCYSCHPLLRRYWDLYIFMTADISDQLVRIEKRNGPQAAAVFKNRWIPLEEQYFAAFHVQETSSMVFCT